MLRLRMTVVTLPPDLSLNHRAVGGCRCAWRGNGALAARLSLSLARRVGRQLFPARSRPIVATLFPLPPCAATVGVAASPVRLMLACAVGGPGAARSAHLGRRQGLLQVLNEAAAGPAWGAGLHGAVCAARDRELPASIGALSGGAAGVRAAADLF